jgi:hypothetical protein
MAPAPKKTVLQSEPFDDIIILGISAAHTDFVMAWHLNARLNLRLVKKENLRFNDQKASEVLSFYYYNQGENASVFNLIMLNKTIVGLTKLPQSTDYMLILRNNVTSLPLDQIRRDIRSIPGVVLSYVIEWQKFKSLDSLLEQIDLHELSIERNEYNMHRRLRALS